MAPARNWVGGEEITWDLQENQLLEGTQFGGERRGTLGLHFGDPGR